MTLPPWEYLFESFNARFFPDLFYPIVIASVVGLVATVLLYNVRTRQLRRHAPYMDMYEWLLWTGIIFFSLVLTYAVFSFDFLFTVVTIPIGVGILIWIRFVRFPPQLAAYQQKLAKARYLSMQKFAHPEATIRRRASGSRGSSRRRRR